jgi:hypothetical protein
MRHSAATLFALALVALACAGCASFAPPKPWEKGDLARPSMQFGDDRLAERYTVHIYASKEMATGGDAVGGGGCGCN